MISRRNFMRGIAAVAAAPVLPAIAAPTFAGAAPATAAEPFLSYAIGTAGDWNWLPIRARSHEHAVELWMGEQGFPEICEAIEDGETEDPCGDCEYCSNLYPDVVRHEEWDGKPVDIGSRLWCESGLGATCSRCGDEAFLLEGGFFDEGDRLVCDYCETAAEWQARIGEDEAA